MPIIEHSSIANERVSPHIRQRALVSRELGSSSLTIKEVELSPGWEGRLHTHPVDVAVMVMSGAVQMVIDGELCTVRMGSTLLAPPGTPHKLVNQLWIPVRLMVTYPASELETDFLE
jgi:quercetin dioxygenase-like cupin family protein